MRPATEEAQREALDAKIRMFENQNQMPEMPRKRNLMQKKIMNPRELKQRITTPRQRQPKLRNSTPKKIKTLPPTRVNSTPMLDYNIDERMA